MTYAIPTAGTLIEVESLPKGSGVWNAIEEIASIGASGATSSEIDATHLRSTAKEYLLGLPDNGRIPLQGNYLGTGYAGQAQMLTAFNDRSERNFRITFADSVPATVLTFPGRCMGFDVAMQPDSKVDLTITIRVTGSRTFT